MVLARLRMNRHAAIALAIALTAACSRHPNPADVAALLASQDRPSPQVRNLTEPKAGLVCGEVRWIALSGHYGSWWPFHVLDGKASVGEFYPPFAPFPGTPVSPAESAFDAEHAACR